MSKDSHPEAERIIRQCLEDTGAALLSDDFPRFIKYFRLPHISETFDGTRVFETQADMERAFDVAVSYYRQNNVTQIQRDVLAAVFVDKHKIHATHQTRLIATTMLVKKPHIAFSEAGFWDGQWQATITRYAITEAPALEAALGGDYKDTMSAGHRHEGCDR